MADHSKNKYGILVAELRDVVPRRVSTLPNLYVGITTMDLMKRFDVLNTGKGSTWLENNLTKLRHDLSTPVQISNHDSAKDLKKKLVHSLKSKGYTVNRNTDLWTVYVIELDPNAINDPGKGYLYVGETKKTPEARFLEHLNRAKNGKTKLFASVVANHGKRLRMDLAPDRKYMDSASSKQAEGEWANNLRALGYTVKGGH
jgi:predicted GIY-YIG superfamily endonuclease